MLSLGRRALVRERLHAVSLPLHFLCAALRETLDPGVDLTRGKQAFDLDVRTQSQKIPLCGELARIGWWTQHDDAIAVEHRNVGRHAFIPDPVICGRLTEVV